MEHKKTNKVGTDVLVAIYQQYQDLVVNANQKLYFLFGINSALLMSFIFKYNDILVKSENENTIFFLNGLFFLSLFFVLINLFLILYEVMPKISSDVHRDSLVSFSSLSNTTTENFKKILSDILNNEESLKEDIIRQIIHLSKILTTKYRNTIAVTWLTILSSVSIGLLLIINSTKLS